MKNIGIFIKALYWSNKNIGRQKVEFMSIPNFSVATIFGLSLNSKKKKDEREKKNPIFGPMFDAGSYRNNLGL